MAKAYKCDRCGNYYDGNKMHSSAGGRLCSVSINTQIQHAMNYDLCDRCIGEFFEFIKNER